MAWRNTILIAPPHHDRVQVREVEELRAQAAQLRSTQAELDRAREELRQHKEVPPPIPIVSTPFADH